LRGFLAGKRDESGLRQADLARKLKRRQDSVSDIETGQKMVTVVG
jgi:ribosome-binding protein aMBF1 (putative translation factor)